MWIVDRFEEDYVVLEDENKVMHDVKRDCFPEEIKAGDVVYKKGNQYVVDQEATDCRAEKIRAMMDSLWE